MNFSAELVKGTILKCYKNLILDVKIGNKVVAAFCPELDAQQNLYSIGREVWLLPVNHPHRKLRYETQMINHDGSLVMISPEYSEILLQEAFRQGNLEGFQNYNRLRRVSVQDDLHYVHFEFSNEREEKCYVYAVNIYNKQGGNVVFPSGLSFYQMAVFTEFEKLRKAGYETKLLFLVPRDDCADIQFVWTVNPMAAARIFDEAKNGLKFCGYGCTITTKDISINRKMKIVY